MDFKYINIIFSLFIIAAMAIWMYFLLFTSIFDEMLPPTQKYIFIGVLALYTIFRGFRIYSSLKK